MEFTGKDLPHVMPHDHPEYWERWKRLRSQKYPEIVAGPDFFKIYFLVPFYEGIWCLYWEL